MDMKEKIFICLLYFLDFYVLQVKAGIQGIKIKPFSTVEDAIRYPDIKVVSGTTVILPCNLSNPAKEDAIALVLWYRLDLPNPIYTIDARIQPWRHFSSRLLGTRATFNTSRSISAHLKVDPVQEGDEGEYRCRIDFKRGRTLNRLIKINVIVPVKKVVIKGRHNVTYNGLIGPFIEGEKLVLTCVAIGGRPSPVLLWSKNSRFLHGTSSRYGEGNVTSDLVLTSLSRKDLLSLLVCQAANSNLTYPAYASLTIDLHLSPLNVQIVTVLGVLKAGDVLELKCHSEGSRPPASLTWSKDGENLTHTAAYSTDSVMSSSTLVTKLRIEDNRKKIQCQARNPHLPKSALQDSLILNVQYPPHLTLVFGASIQYEYLREGSDVYFECNVQANPSIKGIIWRFQSVVLRHSPSEGIVVRNHSLLIHSVTKDSRGSYQCLAENAHGWGKSEEVFLRVQYTPVCSTNQQRTYSAYLHNLINISCSVEADPSDASFQWIHNGIVLNVSTTVTATPKGRTSTIEYQLEKMQDFGRLLCQAQNGVGGMKRACVFNILPKGPPPPLLNCGVHNRTTHEMSIACDYDLLHTPPTYHLEVYDTLGENLIANVTSQDEPTFHVSHLPSGAQFVIALYASTSQGKSQTVAFTTNTFLPTTRETKYESYRYSSTFIAVLVVASAFLILLIVLIGVLFCKNKTRAPSQKDEDDRIERDFNKISSSEKQNVEDTSFVYHTSDISKAEYIHLSSQYASQCLFDGLMREKQQSRDCSLHMSPELDEQIEVHLSAIER